MPVKAAALPLSSLLSSNPSHPPPTDSKLCRFKRRMHITHRQRRQAEFVQHHSHARRGCVVPLPLLLLLCCHSGGFWGGKEAQLGSCKAGQQHRRQAWVVAQTAGNRASLRRRDRVSGDGGWGRARCAHGLGEHCLRGRSLGGKGRRRGRWWRPIRLFECGVDSESASSSSSCLPARWRLPPQRCE